jgi:predicted  nucleic acid-binding Zn-ribbon protein
LEKQLQDELNCHNAEREEHERELAALAESSAQSESAHAKHQEEVITLRKELDHCKLALQAVQEEKDAIQLHVTNLEAEIQRAVSLRRYLESQLKDG